jgi:hypothetical protein
MNAHLALLALVHAAWWLASRLWWPFRPCPRCQGRGTNQGSTRRRHGTCPPLPWQPPRPAPRLQDGAPRCPLSRRLPP